MRLASIVDGVVELACSSPLAEIEARSNGIISLPTPFGRCWLSVIGILYGHHGAF